ISTEYFTLLDELEGRLHVDVTVARMPSDEEKSEIAAHLSRTLGKKVVPHLRVDPAILGGVVVRAGDMVMDGSVRKRLATLRRRMLA
ncbi:MAG TPA: ATP synthase F1 subunit delta, partial [Gemmatimonadaceae bacterium]|nr:ATP synthase F1 subunit delta [Gemmatimonadaceae bacterium]